MGGPMKIACIGECMVEVAGLTKRQGEARIGFGGDTLNTAVYLARLLNGQSHDVHYVTRLGTDPHSDNMIEAWQAEGINCEHVQQIPEREAGLYAIDVDGDGERQFTYWRSQSPARELFEGHKGAALIEHLTTFDAIYFSGITLAVLLPSSRVRLLALAGRMKDAGRMVIYDTNFRSRLWPNGDAPNVNAGALHASTLVLPSAEDLGAIFSDQDGSWQDFLNEFSIPEIVLKHGGAQLDIFFQDAWSHLEFDMVAHPVDTTAAGDSFNAGYLAAKLLGNAPADCAVVAHELASAVISQPGAIISPDAMPKSFHRQQSTAKEASA